MNHLFIYLFCLAFISCSSDKQRSSKPLNSTVTIEVKNSISDYGPSNKIELETDFVDQTKKYGLENVEASGLYLIDLDGDGHADLVTIKDFYGQPNFYLFDKDKQKFVFSNHKFLSETVKASGAVFNDYNNDGIIDVIFYTLNQKSALRSTPLSFFFGTKAKGIQYFKRDKKFEPAPENTASIAVGDFDLNGYLDLYLANWYQFNPKYTLPSADSVYLNKGGTFTKDASFLKGEEDQNLDQTMYLNARPSFATQTCDINGDGYPDALVASSGGFANKMWINSKGNQMVDYGISSGLAADPEGINVTRGGGNSFTLNCADYNRDKIMDVFVGETTHTHDSEQRDRSSILTGSTFKHPPKFIRTEYVLDAHDPDWSQSDRRAVWFDYNNDGLLDLLVDNTGYPPHTRLVLFKQSADHSFENIAKEAGIDFVNPSSSVIGDFNRDGKMDIISAQTNLRDSSIKNRLYLFINKTQSSAQNYRFYLQGNKASKEGIGATVRVKTKIPGSLFRLRTLHNTFSYGTFNPTNERGLHFAIPSDEKIVNVEILWPVTFSEGSIKKVKKKLYKLKSKKTTAPQVVTFCENGLFFHGKKKCLF